jgi:hypothetical protein
LEQRLLLNGFRKRYFLGENASQVSGSITFSKGQESSRKHFQQEAFILFSLKNFFSGVKKINGAIKINFIKSYFNFSSFMDRRKSHVCLRSPGKDRPLR